MKLQSRTCIAMALSAAAVLTGTQAHADLVEATSWSGSGTEYNYNKAVGWQFRALDDMIVTHLGVLDMGSAGLSEAHTIGIFNSDGSLVVSTQVGDGLSGDSMFNSMIYNDVTLTPLKKNETYYILADNWTQDAYTFGQSVSTPRTSNGCPSRNQQAIRSLIKSSTTQVTRGTSGPASCTGHFRRQVPWRFWAWPGSRALDDEECDSSLTSPHTTGPASLKPGSWLRVPCTCHARHDRPVRHHLGRQGCQPGDHGCHACRTSARKGWPRPAS